MPRTSWKLVLAGAVGGATLIWVGVGPAAAEQANLTTPGTQNFTVPSGVTQLGISMCGAQGGKGGNGETVPPAELAAQAVTVGGAGGQGARVEGNLTVTPGETLRIT
jgi:hypothetical protein